MRTTSTRSVIASLALACCAFAPLAACGTDDDGYETEMDALSIRYGVDYAWARPSLTTLRSQGYSFVARYASHDTSGKNLSHAEATQLIAAGFDIVSNWEAAADDALSGYSQGVADAHAANAQFASYGAPSTRPIYFSIDFDATAGQQATINAYFDGVASVIGRGRTGAYGGYYPIKRLFDAGKIHWAWQTYAWSGGLWDPRAQLRQIQNGIDNDCCDRDEAVAVDFGQWGHHAAPTTDPRSSGSSAVIDKNGTYHVFTVSNTGALDQTYYTQGAWHWQTLGGTISGTPGVAYNPTSNRYDVFAPSPNGHMYQKTYLGSGAWQPWHEIGGNSLGEGAAAVLDANGIYHVFSIDRSGVLWQAYYTGGAWHWQKLGGTVTGTPGVAYNPATNRFDVFAPSPNGHMYQKTYVSGAWHAWHEIGGGNLFDGASAVIDSAGVYHVFTVTSAGVLYQAYYTGGAWHWQNLTGTVTGTPGVTYNPASKRYDVFAASPNGHMYQKTYASSTWHAWHAIGGTNLAVARTEDGDEHDDLIGETDIGNAEIGEAPDAGEIESSEAPEEIYVE